MKIVWATASALLLTAGGGAALTRPAVFASTQTPVTWSGQIAPIVARSCAQCHFPGGPAPFSLLSYSLVQMHAQQIAQVTASGYMPPWLPTAQGIPLAHARRLSAADIALFQQWSQQNAPQGKPPVTIPAPTKSADTFLGKPSLTLTMPKPYVLPGETTSPYRCFVLPLHLTQTRWLRALTFTSGNAVVARQAEFFVDTTGTARRLEADSGAVGYVADQAGLGPKAHRIAEWSVGSGPWILPTGVAEKLPAHADLVLMMRFETDGESEPVRPSVHLYFTPTPPRVSPVSVALGSPNFIIQPPEKGTITDHFTLPVAARLLRMTPFGNPVCRTLRVDALLPNHSAPETLLQIADWNADWQASYQPLTPPVLPAGTQLTMQWTVDNSKDNPRNPSNPPMTVSPSIQYEDGMATVHLQFVPAQPADAAALRQVLAAPRPAPVIVTTMPHRHG